MLQIILLLILLVSGGELSGSISSGSNTGSNSGSSGGGSRGIDIPRKPSTSSFIGGTYPRFLSVGRTPHASDTSHPSNSIELRPRSSSFHPFPSIGHTVDISNPEDVLVEVITRLDLWEAAHAHLRSQGAEIYAAFTEDETQFRSRAAEPFFYNKQYRSVIIEDAKRLLLSFVAPSRQLEARRRIPSAESFYNFVTWWNECLIQLNFMERPRLSRQCSHPAQASSDHSSESGNSDNDSFHTMDSAGSASEDLYPHPRHSHSHGEESIIMDALPGWIRALLGPDQLEKTSPRSHHLTITNVMIGKAVLGRFATTPKVACYRLAQAHTTKDRDNVHSIGLAWYWFLFKVINVMAPSDEFIFEVVGGVCRSIADPTTLSDDPFVLHQIAVNIFNSSPSPFHEGDFEECWRTLWPGIPLPNHHEVTSASPRESMMNFYFLASEQDKHLLKAQSEILDTIPPWHALYQEIYHFNAAVITRMNVFIGEHAEYFGISLAILSASDIYDLFLPNHFQSNAMSAFLDTLAVAVIGSIDLQRLQSLCRQHLDATTAAIEHSLTQLVTGQTPILLLPLNRPMSAAEATAIRTFMTEKIVNAVQPRSSSIGYILSWLNLASAGSTPID